MAPATTIEMQPQRADEQMVANDEVQRSNNAVASEQQNVRKNIVS